MCENILIESIPQKSKPARRLITFGIIMFLLAFLIGFWYYDNVIDFGMMYVQQQEYNWELDRYEYVNEWEWEYGLYRLDDIYPTFSDYFLEEFFIIGQFHGYVFMLGFALVVAGIIVKLATRKSKLSVASDVIYGKRGRRPELQLPLHMITGIKGYGSYGVEILCYNTIYRFPCIKNRDEIIRTISQLLTFSPGERPQTQYQSAPVISRSNSTLDFD